MMKNGCVKGGEFSLDKASVGDEVVVVDLKITNPILKRRLLEMGITKGVNLTLKRKAPLGSPLCFMVRGYGLGVRIDEAKLIMVRLKK